MILLKGGYYLTPDDTFQKGDILLEGENIRSVETDIKNDKNDAVFHFPGCKIIPGLIDIHIHGAAGYDVMASTPHQIGKIAKHLAREGTTSFFPTTITAEMEEINTAIQNIKQAALLGEQGASIEGIHIEGPYLNPEQKGCHDALKMKPPIGEEYQLFKISAGRLKLYITLAPELPHSMEFIELVSKDSNVISIGHSSADLATVKTALDHGAVTFTHLFNAMKGLHHREPGTAGAGLITDAYAELICDGIHIHPDNVKLVYKAKGKDKIILVSDAMQAKGLGDGCYVFGGFPVMVTKGIARKEDGALASSTLSMFQAVKNASQFMDIPLEEAVQMASLNPARAMGIDHRTGSIQIGKRADLVVMNENQEIISVFCKGRKVE